MPDCNIFLHCFILFSLLISVSRQISGECGGVLTTETGVIRTPNFPYDYPPNQLCTWEIRVPSYRWIRLNFTHFHIQKSKDCQRDRVVVSSQSPVDSTWRNSTYCGSRHRAPTVWISDGNVLRITFVSDGTVQKGGFSASYFTDYCGGVLRSVEGVITSPNYPEPYEPNRHCVWHIMAPPRTQLIINITHFNVQSCKHCECDWVLFSNRNRDNDDFYCGGGDPFLETRFDHNITIQFVSDHAVEHSGFAASFNIIGGEFFSNGTF